MSTKEKIVQQIAENPILLYMKGSPEAPQCGFSAQVVRALMACGEKFAYINVLEDPDLRQEVKNVSDWPTFPQLYLKGEFIGGCDIVMDLYQSGKLQAKVKEAVS